MSVILLDCYGPEVRRSGSPEVWRVLLAALLGTVILRLQKMLEPIYSLAPAFLQPHNYRPYRTFTDNHAGLPDFRTSGLPDQKK